MSIEMNLLPWRELLRKNARRKFFIIALFGLAILALGFLAINYYVSGLVEQQQDVNQMLHNEIEQSKLLLNKTKKIKNENARLIARISLLQQLENSSVLILHFFDELARLMPEGINLSQIKGRANRIVLKGNSASNSALSLLMQKIETNPWMARPNLIEIKNESEQRGNNSFTLSFTLEARKAGGQQP